MKQPQGLYLFRQATIALAPSFSALRFWCLQITPSNLKKDIVCELPICTYTKHTHYNWICRWPYAHFYIKSTKISGGLPKRYPPPMIQSRIGHWKRSFVPKMAIFPLNHDYGRKSLFQWFLYLQDYCFLQGAMSNWVMKESPINTIPLQFLFTLLRWFCAIYLW